MRVLVDTSVWVDFINGHLSPERNALHELIAGEDDLCTCGVVVAEVFQGLRREPGRDDLAAHFHDMTFLEPRGIDLYLRAAEIYRKLRQRGLTIRSTIDCLIAVLAEENGCHVLERDKDLKIILSSGLVAAKPWPTLP